MRFGNSYWCTVAILTALACSESNGVPGPATSSGCEAGKETCNGECVEAGACDSAGSGGASSTKKSSKASQTGGKASTAKGGTSQTEAEGGEPNGEGGQGEGGSSDEPTATGGASKGGTSAGKGGTSSTAKGGTSATAKGGTTATAKGGTSSTWVDDPTKCDDKSTASGTLTDRYLRRMITIQDPNRNYVFHTNWWGNYVDQSVDVDGLGFTVTKNSASNSDQSLPVGFPSIFIGKYQKNKSTGSNLPKQVSAIKSIPTLLDSSTGGGDLNISYDVWFTGGSSPLGDGDSDPGGSGRLLMLWLNKQGNKVPRGQKNGTANLAGRAWDVWQDAGTSDKAACRSYVAQSATNSLPQFDLNEFIKHAVSGGFLTSSMYLSVVFAGTEIWTGGSGTKIKNFCAKVY